MAPPVTSAHVAIHTLEHLSRSISRAAAQNPKMSFTSLVPQKAGTYALGGLGIRATGVSRPAPIAPGSFVRMELKSGTSMAASSTMHPAVAFGYENPSVRFGDRTKTSSRPKSAEGATSFHFSHSYQSKTSPIQQMIREFHGGRKYSNSKAADHLLYIEREGAAEKMDKPNDPFGYDEFEEESEFEKIETAAAGRNSNDQQDYLERLGAVERVRLKSLTDDDLGNLEYASFGNIGTTPQERHYFWAQVEKIERSPQGDTINIRLAGKPEACGLLQANLKSAPKAIKSRIDLHDAGTMPAELILKNVPTKAAFEIYKWAVGLDPEFPIEIEPGRGGRVQNRIIAELPFELDPIDRVNIVNNFIQVLKDEKDRPLPYWAVVHAPDENNDKRNYHVHIIYYDRPAELIRDPQDVSGRLKWDFEIEDEKIYGCRHRKMHRPFMKPKLREANGKDWIPKLRARWEGSCNQVMQEVGLDKRYDRRTYKEMGIDLDPLKHIPSKTFNKERKGELTEEGVALARRQWDNVKDTIVSVNATRTRARREKVEKKVKRAEAALLKENPFKGIASKEIKRLAILADTLARRVGIAELYQDLGRVVIDRTASRARLVFHAAIDERGKKKRGRPAKNPGAQALNGATKPLAKDAIEARDFLHVLLPRGKSLDQKNQMEFLAAQSSLHTVLRRIDALYKNPKQHPLDTRQPGYLDLHLHEFDPADQAKKKAEMIERVQASLNSYADTVAIPAIKASLEKARTEEVKAPPQSAKTVSIPSPLPAGSGGKLDPTPAASPVAAQPTAPIVVPTPTKAEPEKPKVTAPPRARFRFEPFPKPEPRNTPQKSASTARPTSPASGKTPPAAAKPAPVQSAPVNPKPSGAAPARPAQVERAATPASKAAAVPPVSAPGKPTPAAAPSQVIPKAPEPPVAKPVTPASRRVTSSDKPAPAAPPSPAPAVVKPEPTKAPIEIKTPLSQGVPSKPAGSPASQGQPDPKGSVTVPPLPASELKREIKGMVITKQDTSGSSEKPRSPAEPKPSITVGKPVSSIPRIDGITITMPPGATGTPDKKDKDVQIAPAFGQPSLPEPKPPLPPGPKKPTKPKKGLWRPDSGFER